MLDMLYNVISSVESIMNIIQVLLTVVTVIGFTKTCGRLDNLYNTPKPLFRALFLYHRKFCEILEKNSATQLTQQAMRWFYIVSVKNVHRNKNYDGMESVQQLINLELKFHSRLHLTTPRLLHNPPPLGLLMLLSHGQRQIQRWRHHPKQRLHARRQHHALGILPRRFYR